MYNYNHISNKNQFIFGGYCIMSRYKLNCELAQMLKGGVIMDVTTPEQAKIAEEAGACAVMALERIPADIRAAGGVSRMSDPKMIKGIQEAVSIPVMAKCQNWSLCRSSDSYRLLKLTTLMKVKFFLQQTMFTTLTRLSLMFLSFVVQRI